MLFISPFETRAVQLHSVFFFLQKRKQGRLDNCRSLKCWSIVLIRCKLVHDLVSSRVSFIPARQRIVLEPAFVMSPACCRREREKERASAATRLGLDTR